MQQITTFNVWSNSSLDLRERFLASKYLNSHAVALDD
jgi:hypothetical protein